jgi:hypothetical protein
LYPDQQEAYEESVAKGQIDVANSYRAQAGLKALSTKSTPFRFWQIATAITAVAIAALVAFWQQRIDRARRLVEDDTPDSSTEPKLIGFFGVIRMGCYPRGFHGWWLLGVVAVGRRSVVAPSLIRLVFNMVGAGGDAAGLHDTDGDHPPSLTKYLESNPLNGAAYPDTTTTATPNPALCCNTADSSCFDEGHFSGVFEGDPFGIITQEQAAHVMGMIKGTEKVRQGIISLRFFPSSKTYSIPRAGHLVVLASPVSS